jgi:hypothetical protein
LKSNPVPILAVLLAVACDPIRQPCFTPPSQVKDVRILAIAADPPEARIDPATGVADPVSLRALIVEPHAEVRSASVTWELCVPSDDFPGCPPGSAIASDPQWGPSTSLRVQVMPGLLQQAKAADPLRGLRDVRVRAVVHVEGARPPSASALLFFSSQPQPLNRAPVIAGLRTGRDGAPLVEVSPGNLFLELSEQHTNAIRPVLDPGSLEEYDSVDLAGKAVHLRERVTYSFFADDTIALGRGLVLKQGAIPIVIYRGLDDFEADEPQPGTPDTPQGLFDAVAVHAGGSSGTIWIVARDSRGASSWVSVPYTALEERPECEGPPPHGGCPQLQFGCL